MYKPTIFFCPSKKALELSEITGFPVMAPRNFHDVLRSLIVGNSIIVTELVELMGWVAPNGTKVFYIEGFPGDGTSVRKQAEGRYSRLNQDVSDETFWKNYKPLTKHTFVGTLIGQVDDFAYLELEESVHGARYIRLFSRDRSPFARADESLVGERVSALVLIARDGDLGIPMSFEITN